MRGQVVDLDRCDGAVVMRDGDGQDHHLDQEVLGSDDVQHAYAITVHTAQGITVGVALVSGTSTLCKEAGYVALSRGRISNHLFVTVADLQAAAPEMADDHERERLDQLQQQLERRSAHRLATSYGIYPEVQRPEPKTRGIER